MSGLGVAGVWEGTFPDAHHLALYLTSCHCIPYYSTYYILLHTTTYYCILNTAIHSPHATSFSHLSNQEVDQHDCRKEHVTPKKDGHDRTGGHLL